MWNHNRRSQHFHERILGLGRIGKEEREPCPHARASSEKHVVAVDKKGSLLQSSKSLHIQLWSLWYNHFRGDDQTTPSPTWNYRSWFGVWKQHLQDEVQGQATQRHQDNLWFEYFGRDLFEDLQIQKHSTSRVRLCLLTQWIRIYWRFERFPWAITQSTSRNKIRL